MYKIGNVLDNNHIRLLKSGGAFKVIEYTEPPVNMDSKQDDIYNQKLNITKKQVICDLTKSPVIIDTENYLWEVGEIVNPSSGGVLGDLFKKNNASKETVSNQVEYDGEGYIMLKTTEKDILLIDMGTWNEQVTIDEHILMAAEAAIKQKLISRSGLNSVASAKGNCLSLVGKGYLCVEIPYPESYLTTILLEKDIFKLESGKALMWSSSLKFSVETTPGGTQVDVFRGSGKIIF